MYRIIAVALALMALVGASNAYAGSRGGARWGHDYGSTRIRTSTGTGSTRARTPRSHSRRGY